MCIFKYWSLCRNTIATIICVVATIHAVHFFFYNTIKNTKSFTPTKIDIKPKTIDPNGHHKYLPIWNK